MNTTTVSEKQSVENPFQPPRTAHNARRRISNIIIITFSLLATAFAVCVLLFLLLYVLRAGLPYINLDLFTKIPSPNGEPGGGLGPAIQGSLILVGLAALFGVPLGLFTGIYLSEFGGRGFISTGVRFLVDVLTGIPTIIFGLFAWVFVVVPQQSFSGLAGGVALGIIMIPIVARTSEEVLRLVPKELREASLALGATESRTILRVVIPAASSGIITGIILAMARVAGETAPLLMTAFGNPFFNSDITQPMDALPLRIFNFAESPYQGQINQAYAGSLVLIVLILLTSFAIRWATGGFRRNGR
ncbi:MAG TPA: phosphate ABC transporter permease PstA [Ktedonobacteraceae bacterium]|nr:phosphate ABC transporter permease PstA [Ktedonobacteraceae bacterium]